MTKTMFEILTEKLAKEISDKIWLLDIKEIGENWTFKVVASDETVDRAGEVIKVSWRDLLNFMKNPVIVANHIYKVENIIWKATNVFVENDKLVVEWVFATTDLAQDVRKLYDGGFLKTVSVGFIPKERDPENQRIITRAELLEVSFVPVPCNPNALSLWKEIVDGLIEKWLIIKTEDAPETSDETESNPNEEVEQDTTCEEENENENSGDENSLDNGEEKSIKEMTEVNLEKDIYDQLQDQVREIRNTKYIYVVEIFTKHFIFRDDVNLKYFDQNWKIKGENAVVDGEPVEVAPKTTWIAKAIQKSNRELLDEIKSWLSNDKDDDVDKKDIENKMKLQKEALQNVSKVVSDVLHKIKL